MGYRKLNYLFLLLVSVCGCTSINYYQRTSSGVIGCSPNEISITNLQASCCSPNTWTAECKGVKYYCNQSLVSTSCAQAKG